MSLLRSGKAINNKTFGQPQNTLISKISLTTEFFSKIDEKITILNSLLNGDTDGNLIFVWVGIKSSHVFDINKEDAQRLLDNYNKND